MEHPPDRSGLRAVAVLGGLALVMGAAPAAPSAAGDDETRHGIPRSVKLVVHHAVVVKTAVQIKRAAVAGPDIAEVTVLSPTQVLISGRKAGTTQVVLWDPQDNAFAVQVLVTGDKAQLEDQLHELFPTSRVTVTVSQGTLVLDGTAESSVQAHAIVKVAEAYSAQVVNSLKVAGAKQILLRVRVSEVSRSLLRRLGINAVYANPEFFLEHSTNEIGTINIGRPAGDALVRRMPFDFLSPAAGGQNSNLSFGVTDARIAVFLDALKENGLLTILAEPNLVACSGQRASFLVGGEFPVPVPQDQDTITIEYREYGVRLNFVATLLDGGAIRLEVEPEVSDVDFSTAVQVQGFVVPGRVLRKVATAVELKRGQTFVIAGLISKSMLATKSTVPVLGEVPVVGAAFQSTVHQEEETELLVMVTPELVDPLQVSQVPHAPTDYVRGPTDVELFLFGVLDQPVSPGARAKAAAEPIPVLMGPTGQQLGALDAQP